MFIHFTPRPTDDNQHVQATYCSQGFPTRNAHSLDNRLKQVIA